MNLNLLLENVPGTFTIAIALHMLSAKVWFFRKNQCSLWYDLSGI